MLKTLVPTEELAQIEEMEKQPNVRARFFAELDGAHVAEDLFDQIPDIVFFLKDVAGRYVAVNETLVKRLGRRRKGELIGRSASELFPATLAERIARQDHDVVCDGKSIHGQLELHLYPNGGQGWCLTWKEPVRGKTGRIIGLSGISRDLQPVQTLQSDMSSLSVALDYIRKNLDQPLLMPELAKISVLSNYQFDQRIRSLFGVSAGQYVTRARIELACNRLRQTDQAISRIALDCGYGDQAAFARQFRKLVGLTPKAYRDTPLLQQK